MKALYFIINKDRVYSDIKEIEDFITVYCKIDVIIINIKNNRYRNIFNIYRKIPKDLTTIKDNMVRPETITLQRI